MEPSTGELQGQNLEMPDAAVTFYSGFMPEQEADACFEALAAQTVWKQETIKLYGKVLDIPRLTAWYGDAGKTYTYSGITVTPEPWTPELLHIRVRVEAIAGVAFNSVLLNYYRDQRDSVSWHSDDEPELGTNPIIASVSFGAKRPFQLKHRTDPKLRTSVELTHGSLLLMYGTTQHYWKHQIPKSTKTHEPRINLTFRIIR